MSVAGEDEAPESSSFFSAVGGGCTAEEVAAAYGRAGWEVRPCGWTEHEVRCERAELVVERAADRVLVHGPVADAASADDAVAPLRAAGLAFTAECYDSRGVLVRELRSPAG